MAAAAATGGRRKRSVRLARPPDMDDVIRKGQERLKNLIPGGLGSVKGVVLIVLPRS